MSSALTGSRRLLLATAEQDRLSIAPWIALVTALSVSSVIAYPWVFPDEASRAQLATTVGASPALGLIFGEARELTTAEGFNAWRSLGLGGFFTALMAIFTVVRNSRAAEDSGQAELLAAGVLGRGARLGAAVGLAAVASVAVGVVSALAAILAGASVPDTLALSATFTASGLMFAGVAAVAAQLGSDARTATTIAVVTLGTAYLARGYVDASAAPDWATWLTPLGWTQQVRPAAGNDWTPLLACLALFLVLVTVAIALQSRRDFGQGVIPVRPGPDRAGRAARLPVFVVLLHRGSVISWTVAFVVLGFVFGTLATSVGELLAETPEVGRLIAAGGVSEESLVFRFVLTVISLVGIIAAVYGVQTVMRVRSEELAGRVEPVLGTAVSRPRFLAAHFVVAMVGPAVGLLVGGSVVAAVASSQESTIQAGDVLRQAVVAVPAVWVLTALAITVVGARPRARVVPWFAVVVTFLLTILGPILGLDDRVLGISPFRHVPDVTDPGAGLGGLVWLGAVAVVLVVIGFVGFRRRDIG